MRCALKFMYCNLGDRMANIHLGALYVYKMVSTEFSSKTMV